MSLLRELKKIRPETIKLKLGQHSVYRYDDVTPAHRYVSILKLRNRKWIVQLNSRDSYCDALAIFLLNQTDRLQMNNLHPDRLTVTNVTFPAPWKFQTVVVVPPLIWKGFENKSVALTAATFWFVPAFASDFLDGIDGKVFWHQLRRKDGWRIHPIDWNRELKRLKKCD
jgi:hypothetical protein